MKAVGFRAPLPITDADALVDLELPTPAPGPHDLLVRVRAVSVNPVDVKVRASTKPPEGEARVLGWDAAGVVERAGEAAKLFKVGDEVFYAGEIGRPGSNAELQIVDERIVGRKPSTVGFAEAASLPLTSITAWELLFDRLGVPQGKKDDCGTLLVINGAGGVGSILIQLARRLTGLRVVATASRPETRAWVEKMGAHHVIDHLRPMVDQIKGLGLAHVECIAGLTASGQHAAAMAEMIAPFGKICLIDDPKTFDIVPFKRKSVSVAWELMFTRSIFETPDMIEQHRLLDEVSALVEAGVLVPTLNERAGKITAADLRRAHAAVEAGKSIGKTVLEGF